MIFLVIGRILTMIRSTSGRILMIRLTRGRILMIRLVIERILTMIQGEHSADSHTCNTVPRYWASQIYFIQFLNPLGPCVL